MDFNHKISDTSLFAELVKDKHKRDKVLQEIMDKKEEAEVNTTGENSNNTISAETNSYAPLSEIATSITNVVSTTDLPVSTVDDAQLAVLEPVVDVQVQLSQTTNPQTTNGIKDGVCLVDIPMPNTADGTIADKAVFQTGTITSTETQTSTNSDTTIAIRENTDTTDGIRVDTVVSKMSATSLLPPPPPPPPPPPQKPSVADDAPVPPQPPPPHNNVNPNVNVHINSNLPVITNFVDPAANVNLIPVIKATYTITKPKSLTKLPMPPGVNIGELEDITTPSPPRSDSPIDKRPASPPPLPSQMKSYSGHIGSSSSTNRNDGPPPPMSTNTKKGLLNLPMPPMVPGSEDLSGDDDMIGSPRPSSRNSIMKYTLRKEAPTVKRKRPTILNRRNSRSQMIKDWGERCVDVFEVIAQIGEGTYGQV